MDKVQFAGDAPQSGFLEDLATWVILNPVEAALFAIAIFLPLCLVSAWASWNLLRGEHEIEPSMSMLTTHVADIERGKRAESRRARSSKNASAVRRGAKVRRRVDLLSSTPFARVAAAFVTGLNVYQASSNSTVS